MQGMGGLSPFDFNFDPMTFKIGNVVSYRVSGSRAGWPLAGTLIEVHHDHVIISADPDDPSSRLRGTRESRPLVDEAEIR